MKYTIVYDIEAYNRL